MLLTAMVTDLEKSHSLYTNQYQSTASRNTAAPPAVGQCGRVLWQLCWLG